MNLFLVLFFFLFTNFAFADDRKSFFKDRDFSVYFLSWTKHINSDNKTEGFKNYAFMAGVSIDDARKMKLIFGSLKNSFDNRCTMIGISRDWVKLSNNFDFVGIYAYVGEIPFTRCEHCGDDGTYKSIKKHFNVGFAPYIWHGIRYRATNHLSINAGILFPNIVSASLELRF